MVTVASRVGLLQNPDVTLEKTDRPSRPESRDIVELRNLKIEQPDLASAADMQIELLAAQRRIQSRVPLPAVTFDRRRPDRKQRLPMLLFKDIPIDWTDFRLMIRQTADILKRFETLDSLEYDHIQALARDGQIEAVVSSWYEAAAIAPAKRKGDQRTHEKELLDQVLLLAMRPFLARCAEALLPKLDVGDWGQPT